MHGIVNVLAVCLAMLVFAEGLDSELRLQPFQMEHRPSVAVTPASRSTFIVISQRASADS